MAAATLLIVAGAWLNITHTNTYISGRSLTTGGFVMTIITYGRYSRRLQAENQALRADLQRLRAER